MAESERCEELREALRAARSRLTPPGRESAVAGVQGAEIVNPSDLGPRAAPDVEEEIRLIEQALRDEGCEPD